MKSHMCNNKSILFILIGILIFIMSFKQGNLNIEKNESITDITNINNDNINNTDNIKANANIATNSDIYVLESESQVEEEKITENKKVDSFAFVGDCYISEKNMISYRKGGIDNIIYKSYQKILNSVDLFMANLECSISDRGEAEDKTWTFRIGDEELNVLKEANIDVVSVSNNHTLDYGKEAFLDTLENLKKSNIEYVGGGKNLEEARKVLIKEINNRKYAILAATSVVPTDKWFATSDSAGLNNGYYSEVLVKKIKELKTKVDKVIIYMHWGKEKENVSNITQQQLARAFVNAGCDLVIGSHSHTVQEIEYYKGVPIIYSLGNFIYGSTYTETMVLYVEFDYSNNQKGDLRLKIYPGVSGYEAVKPLFNSNEKKYFFDVMQIKSNTCIIDENGNVYENIK